MCNSRSARTCFGLILLGVIGCGFSAAGAQTESIRPEPLVIVRGIVQAILPLREDPSEIFLATQNPGAGCGGGTPASIWKMTLDPATGELVRFEKQQNLSKIQNTRNTLFEASDGTLFTGSGWCNYKPPYFSTDRGKTWKPADAGPVRPPNSTFSFVEFAGKVYAGTGYEPHHGQVYRWLGEGNWKRVLDVPPPRSIVDRLIVHDDRLFVGSHIYGYGGRGRESSMPVYVSTDGTHFEPTTGIPPSCTVRQLFVVGERLIAWVHEYGDGKKRYVYIWSGTSWRKVGDLGQEIRPYFAVAYDNCTIFGYGIEGADDQRTGLYVSTDMGLSWKRLATLPQISALRIQADTLYLATHGDAMDTSQVCRVPLKKLREQLPKGRDCECHPVSTDGELEPIAAPGPDGLVLHYAFDESDGKATDLSPCGNNGTVHGATFTDGRRGGGYYLNGDNQYIAIPNTPSLEVTTAVTIATWAKLKSFAPGGYGNEHGYLIDKGNDLWWNPAFCLGYAKGSGAGVARRPGKPGPFPALFHVGDDDSAQKHGNHGGKTVRSETLLETGRWYHLAGTYDGQTLKLYINGRLEGEADYGKPIRCDKAPVHLGGGKLFGTGWGNHFTTDAVIDEVRIYNRALAPDELRSLSTDKP